MTKEIGFDLEFKDTFEMIPMSSNGMRFLSQQNLLRPFRHIYRDAIEQGLHVQFETARVRDLLTARYLRSVDEIPIV